MAGGLGVAVNISHGFNEHYLPKPPEDEQTEIVPQVAQLFAHAANPRHEREPRHEN